MVMSQEMTGVMKWIFILMNCVCVSDYLESRKMTFLISF